jgi:carbonic anhydrase/acetyltransferase-like protein (isoleucine patch superfamily)
LPFFVGNNQPSALAPPLSKIGEGSIVAAGALVPENKEFPPHSLIVGMPAKAVREVTEEQAQSIAHGVSEYVERAASHRESLRRGL